MNWLPKHACGLVLTHNDHKNSYESAKQWIENNEHGHHLADWVSEEEKQKAIENDSIWVLHWYPSTPIGFYAIAASSLEALEAHIKEIEP